MLKLDTNCSLIRAIHFSPSDMQQKLICIRSKVEDVGFFQTYIKLKDDTGVIIGDCTNVITNISYLRGKNVVVFGYVKTGQKGLPYFVIQNFKLAN